jgi:hypothetical protein
VCQLPILPATLQLSDCDRRILDKETAYVLQRLWQSHR